ncbi:MAG: hypothetical protein DRJ42_26280 [Deltaproteobacteria bacterium]|nr:MAG: hypothetical protein DRJ42_26280 [Deltaproteobacteria bacterium]
MHHYPITASLGLALIVGLACLTGCGDDSTTATCEAGRQIPCACGGGEEGFQRCRDDGSGYDGCQCDGVDAGGDTGTGDAGADSGMTDSGAADSGTTDTGTTDTGTDSGLQICEGGPTLASCSDCNGCAVASGGPCEAQDLACSAEPDCDAYVICREDCEGSESCDAMCAEDHATGYALFNATSECVFCTACPTSCGIPSDLCAP